MNNIIIVDNRIDEVSKRRLMLDGCRLIELPRDPDLPAAVESHPDTLLFYCDGQIITTADYCDAAAYVFSDIREERPDIRISFTSDRRSARYPEDCIMNALVIGNTIFLKTDSASRAILELANARGWEIVHTNQGYPACSVLHFGNAAITSDRGLGQLMESKGIKVTYIQEGHISLPPYEYGFIGGAGGAVGKKVYFFGNLATHPDARIIEDAVREAGYTPISLCDGELRDLGGIIAL